MQRVILSVVLSIYPLTSWCMSESNQNKNMFKLMTGIFKNHPDTVNKYLERGVHIGKSVSPLGETPLMIALFLGHFEIARQLLAYPQNINATNKFGETALSLALLHHHYQEEIIELLLSKGANIDQKNSMGASLLDRLSPSKKEWLLQINKKIIHNPTCSLDSPAMVLSPVYVPAPGEVSEPVYGPQRQHAEIEYR